MPTHSPSAAVLVAPVQRDRAVTPSAHSSIRAHLEWPFGDSERPYAPSFSGRVVLLAFDESAEAESAARVVAAISERLHAIVSVSRPRSSGWSECSPTMYCLWIISCFIIRRPACRQASCSSMPTVEVLICSWRVVRVTAGSIGFSWGV